MDFMTIQLKLTVPNKCGFRSWKGSNIWTLLYGPVLLHQLGNTGKYSPSCQTNTENQFFQYCPTRKDNTGSISFINWECLCYESSGDIRWNKAWALGKSLGLRLYFTIYPSSCHNTATVYFHTSIISSMQYPSCYWESMTWPVVILWQGHRTSGGCRGKAGNLRKQKLMQQMHHVKTTKKLYQSL